MLHGKLLDAEILEVASSNLVIKGDDTTEKIRSRIERSLHSLVIYEMDAHFINEADNEEFELASVPKDEREKIRHHLDIAKNLASVAEFMSDAVRRSFLIKVSKAESELFKEKVGMQAFLRWPTMQAVYFGNLERMSSRYQRQLRQLELKPKSTLKATQKLRLTKSQSKLKDQGNSFYSARIAAAVCRASADPPRWGGAFAT